jgi:hypothetical protein
MTLLTPLVFHQTAVDTPWTAPAGTLTDGASIPEVFWSVIGGPFEGKYRDAAVNHDYECCVKMHAWQSVHRMFYAGMRANGEEAWLAKLMYFAVYFFGPRWPVSEERTRKRFSEGDIARVARLVQRRPDISLDEIEALSQKVLRAEVPNKPKSMRGAPLLSDSKLLEPVKRIGPCVDSGVTTSWDDGD